MRIIMIRMFKKFIFFLTYKFPFLIQETTKTMNINGIYYQLDLSELIDRSLYYLGCWEPETISFINKYVVSNPNMTFIEVGSNIGAHTFEIARILSKGSGIVYSFEPADFAYNKLIRNYSLNAFNNIVFEKIALSDHQEEKIISDMTPCFRSSWNIKYRNRSSKGGNVKFMSLDKYVSEKGIQEIGIIKIDTDGYEYRILVGGVCTIKRFKPLIFLEVGNTVERVGDSLENLINLIESLGYDIYLARGENYISGHELLHLTAQCHTTNCLCKPSEVS